MIAKVIYCLCSVTSLFCFVALLRGYRRYRTRILLVTSAGFLAFALANGILVVDLIFLPDLSLLLLRNVVTLLGILLLIWGSISST